MEDWQQREILHLLREIALDTRGLRREIRRQTHARHITHFHLEEIFMQPIAPGSSPVYTATPQPDGAVLNPDLLVPVWSSSDEANAPVKADATGLIATVTIPADAVVGTSFTLTVSYTNQDGSVATGTLSQTIVAAAGQANVTSFLVAQTA